MKQNDIRWRTDPVGFGPSTMGGSGCLIVALCKIAEKLRVHTYLDPRRLNELGRRAKAFAGKNPATGEWEVGRGSGALIPELARCAGLEVQRSRRLERARVGSLGVVREALKAALAQGECVLLNVDHDATRVGGDEHPDHWVGAYAFAGDTVLATDAATGRDARISLTTLTGPALWGDPPRTYEVLVMQPVRRMPA